MNLLEKYLARYRQTLNQGEKSESIQGAIAEQVTMERAKVEEQINNTRPLPELSPTMEAPSITTKIQHEGVCPEGPGACGFSMWRFSTATRELEWYCKAKATWCWRSEIATSLEKNG